jgi:hypothetical protein
MRTFQRCIPYTSNYPTNSHVNYFLNKFGLEFTKKKVLSTHVRGQRISRTELVSETQHELTQSGVGNQLRAEFVCELTDAVRADSNPRLFQQRPEVIAPENDHRWADAYHLVYHYFKTNGLAFTLRSAEAECPTGASLGAPMPDAEADLLFFNLLHPPEPPATQASSQEVLVSSSSPTGSRSRGQRSPDSPRRRGRKRSRKTSEKSVTTDSDLPLADD